MTRFQIIVILLIIFILLIILQNKSENLENAKSATNLSNEAIQNISSVYSNTAGQAIFNNVKITGNADIGNFKGIIVMWSGVSVPTGWAICDGTNGTPDLRGRFVLGSGVGKDSSGNNLTERKIGENGGEENHTLTIEEMPSHNHELSGPWRGWKDMKGDAIRAGTTTSQMQIWPTSTNGGSKPHNNMPPFYVLAYIMKL